MSLSITPGALYGFANAGLRPPVATSPKPQPAEESSVPHTQRARRAEEYVAALRELKTQNQDLRHNQATQTYLNVAHFDGGFQLIDVYA